MKTTIYDSMFMEIIEGRNVTLIAVQRVFVLLFLIIWTAFFLIRYFLDRNARAHRLTRNLLTSVAIAIITPLTYQLAPPLWPLMVVSELALFCSFLLVYIVSDQILNDRLPQPLLKHRLFPIIIGISLISFVFLCWKHIDPVFLAHRKDELVWQHNVFYLLKDGTEVFFNLLIASLYWQNLRTYVNLTYFVRRWICMIGFLSGILYIITIDYPIITFAHPVTRPEDSFVQLLLVLQELPLVLLAIGFMTPNTFLAHVLQPVEYYIKQRQVRKQHLLHYLHAQMLLLAPCVQMFEESLKDLRILIEISDARQIIWSNMSLEVPTPKVEAEQLFHLIKEKVVFHEVGPYQPPGLAQEDILHYDLEVAKNLQVFQQNVGKTLQGE